MKYLLFVYYSEDVNSDEEINLIASELSPIVDSNEIKYVFGPAHAIFNFATEMSQPELSIYVDILQEEIGEFKYVLIPTPKNITSNMDPEHLEHLINVNSNMEDNFPDFNFIEILKDNISRINNECYLTIDEILEKIKQHGVNSLTSQEKEKLDNYSQSI